MPLPGSGPISLDDMHVEVGDPAGTLCSIDDANIRLLTGDPQGSIQSFSDFYGTSNSELITVTEGQWNNFGNIYTGYSEDFNGGFGSRSPTTFEGFNITQLWTLELSGGGERFRVGLDQTESDTVGKILIQGYNRPVFPLVSPSLGGDQFQVSAGFYYPDLLYRPSGWNGTGSRTVTLFNQDGTAPLSGDVDTVINVGYENVSLRESRGFSLGNLTIGNSQPLNGNVGSFNSGSPTIGRYENRIVYIGYGRFNSGDWGFYVSAESVGLMNSDIFTSVTLDNPSTTFSTASATSVLQLNFDSTAGGPSYRKTRWFWGPVSAPTSAWNAGQVRTLTFNYD